MLTTADRWCVSLRSFAIAAGIAIATDSNCCCTNKQTANKRLSAFLRSFVCLPNRHGWMSRAGAQSHG